MSILKRTIAAIKDKKSLVVAYFLARSSHRNLDFEAAIIKATSHDEYDIGKSQIVFRWIRASPNNIYPLVGALSRRMRKTRSWVVAIKGLMLMHDLIHCKIPMVEKMGRLQFDLSSFNIFIRRYFAFLDERSAIWFEGGNKNVVDSPLMVQKLLKLQIWQFLLDILLKIRPLADDMKVCLIFEAMVRVVIKIFDVYSKICSEIAGVLLEVHSVGKLQASMAVEILRTATRQGKELSQYFEFCKEYGVLKVNECITVTEIPEEDVEELERIINGASDTTYEDDGFTEKSLMAVVVREEHNAIVEHRETKETLKTIITDKWEIFDDDINIPGEIPDLIRF